MSEVSRPIVLIVIAVGCLTCMPIEDNEPSAKGDRQSPSAAGKHTKREDDLLLISELDLARKYQVPSSESLSNNQSQLDAMSLHSQMVQKLQKQNNRRFLAKNAMFAYNDELVRQKMFPMAASSYGNAQTIEQCILNTFQNAKLYRNIEMACQGKVGELCSAFTALSHDDKAIILVFRGTDSVLQLFYESVQTTFLQRAEAPGGGKIGIYFSKIFDQLVQDGMVIDNVANLLQTYTSYELWVTGHSLGGALAAIASMHIVDAGLVEPERLKLVTFGQPRTGDQQWAEAVDKKLPYFNYRIVHDRDMVPHVPPLWFEGYRHHMTEIFYNNTMATGEHVECASVDEVADCADQYWLYSVNDHMYYFGRHTSDWGKAGCTA